MTDAMPTTGRESVSKRPTVSDDEGRKIRVLHHYGVKPRELIRLYPALTPRRLAIILYKDEVALRHPASSEGE